MMRTPHGRRITLVIIFLASMFFTFGTATARTYIYYAILPGLFDGPDDGSIKIVVVPKEEDIAGENGEGTGDAGDDGDAGDGSDTGGDGGYSSVGDDGVDDGTGGTDGGVDDGTVDDGTVDDDAPDEVLIYVPYTDITMTNLEEEMELDLTLFAMGDVKINTVVLKADGSKEDVISKVSIIPQSGSIRTIVITRNLAVEEGEVSIIIEAKIGNVVYGQVTLNLSVIKL